MDPDFHRPCPGQTQTRCDLYILLLRGIIEHQSRLIADLQRRVAGEPVTWTWIDGVMQSEEQPVPCEPGWHLASPECYEPDPTEGANMTPEKAARPEHIDADPRTDGVGDGGENELDPPTDEEDELQRVKMRPVEETDEDSW